ncbi:MAG: TIM barrel protein [Thermoleophilia bacterium]
MALPPDIGLPSQIYPGLGLGRSLERVAAHASLAEIRSFGPHSLLVGRNRRAAASSGLRLTVHGPFGADVDPGSSDERARRRTLDVHRRHLEAAAEVEALVYVAHPDWDGAPVRYDRAVVAALQRTIADLEGLQREIGVRVVLENMPGRGMSHFVAPGELELGELGLLLDCGHAAISGTLEAFLADPRAELSHVHLHDNCGPGDLDDPHRPLGQGVVDAAAALSAARAAGATVILEHRDEAAALASIAHLEKRGLVPTRGT